MPFRPVMVAAALFLVVLAGGHAVDSAESTLPGWRLVWAEEFDQPDGSAPDPSRWVHDLGGDGWGNNELESYTARRENSRVEGGHLVIEARAEPFAGADKIRRNYTSARLKTQGKFAWTYGRLEARIKVPAGQGIWPAFWTLGANADQVGWPRCGEIDIMENIGREPATVHGTVHGPGYSGGEGIGQKFRLPEGRRFADDFHVFAVEWTTNRIRWLADDQAYFEVTPARLPAGKPWVFDRPQFVLLNLAVGGNWPGAPNTTTVFPQQMLVDYVRVYAATNAVSPALQLKPQSDHADARRPVQLPSTRREGAPSLNGPWEAQPFDGHRQEMEFAAEVLPGFYRLRW